MEKHRTRKQSGVSMEFSEYQRKAQLTDQVPMTEEQRDRSMMLPLMGLAGEVGSLQTQFKRHLRDKEKFSGFKEKIAEELGDILWNVANIAEKSGLDLSAIATENLLKINDRWARNNEQSDIVQQYYFDSSYPPHERFPRSFDITVRCVTNEVSPEKRKLQLIHLGEPMGAPLTDNADEEDGYRLHDAMHLAFVAKLGWSPVFRGKQFFNCKRKSDPEIDQVQDGGRANAIEEAIVALVFNEANNRTSFYQKISYVEYGLLRTIRELTAHLEVSKVSLKDWEEAILQGCALWLQMKTHQEGRIIGNLDKRTIVFAP
jgi:NTP pyrophosphatase (non-canonical NTP hydrolase)